MNVAGVACSGKSCSFPCSFRKFSLVGHLSVAVVILEPLRSLPSAGLKVLYLSEYGGVTGGGSVLFCVVSAACPRLKLHLSLWRNHLWPRAGPVSGLSLRHDFLFFL